MKIGKIFQKMEEILKNSNFKHHSSPIIKKQLIIERNNKLRNVAFVA